MRDLIRRILHEQVNEQRFPRNYWTIDKIKDEINKYSTIKDFRDNSKSAHQAAYSLGKEVFDELTKDLVRLKNGRSKSEITIEDIKREISKYKTLKDFREKNPKFFRFAYSLGDKVYSDLISGLTRTNQWDEDSLEKLAKKFNTKEEFRKFNQGAYTSAKSIGKEFFDKITSHMVSGRAIEGKRRAEENGKNFVNKSKEIFGDKYQYDKVNYVNANTKVTITCPVHGDFDVRPNDHLNMNVGCKWCAVDKRSDENRKTLEDVIKQAKEIHGDIYIYDKVNYTNSRTPITITCNVHGDFQQTPHNHINQKQGCPTCGILKSTNAVIDKFRHEFNDRASKIHDNKYDYSKVDYVNAHTKVEIICPKHGSFFQAPYTHLNGSGCPICKESKGEKEVRTVLLKYNISFIRQKKFEDCVNITLGKDKKTYCVQLPFDFYLPDLNTIIEYDGEQHFKPVSGFGGVKSFNRLRITDEVKNKYCKDNNIKLIRIPYTIPMKDIESLLKQELSLGK
jgi:hypothetical protein